ncbi:MAG: XkdF-like putative serine protease domain-containing protein [Synergistaceae bacterium]|jgi:hypothetical protein|nr:XkdF-like putative serine protease domain-containing protein [Synergistaceae bacterium]
MGDILLEVNLRKSDAKKQIAYGEVYAPDEKDTDGNWMTAETVEKMAHGFMEDLRLDQVDKNHDGETDEGVIVESFIARKGDPDFTEGAWVVGVKVQDKETWESIEKGGLTGLSIEGRCELAAETKGKGD